MKILINPTPAQAPPNNGIGRVIHAMAKYLPKYGIDLTDNEQNADITAHHIHRHTGQRIDVLHCHGLYFSDIPHQPYRSTHYEINRRIAASARAARAVTVPSQWVAMPFQRDMRISPYIIRHGIDLKQWKPGDNQGYILWNKNRIGDVCDPAPAFELARRGYNVKTTFAPTNAGPRPATLTVCGAMDFQPMREIIQNADIYLATTIETFGIGTLEAMASGIPVLGYRWGGTEDIVTHKYNGYLVDPGDIDGLEDGLNWLREHRAEAGKQARETAKFYTWADVIETYANLYTKLLTPDPSGVSVIIPCFNYGKYLGECLESVLAQTDPADEIIVVDDGSTDNTQNVASLYASRIIYMRQTNGGVAAARNNGIDIATQPFAVFLDADDRIAPDFIKILRSALKSDRALGIAYSGLCTLRGDNGIRTPNEFPPEFSWETQSTPATPPMNCIPSACMFRREMWKRAGMVKQEYAPGEDAEFWTRGLSVGFTARKVTEEPLFEYRLHPDGQAHKKLIYKDISGYLPWMHDKKYPFAAPATKPTGEILSYLTPEISVIIPVGDRHEPYLTGAIESVIGQTFRQWELIIIDDTSDGIPERLLTPYPFALVYRTSGRVGAGSAREAGVDRARGRYLVFLDADDYLTGDALGEMLAAHDGLADTCYIYSDYYSVTAGQVIGRELNDYDDKKIEMQHAVTTLFPKKSADMIVWDKTLPGWEDWDYYLQARMKGICGKHLSKKLLYYRIETGTRREISKNQQATISNTLDLRYDNVIKEGFTMACQSCPGAGGGSVIALNSQPEPVNVNPAAIRLEYIGGNTGSRTYTANGRSYRAGNNPSNRYIDIHPANEADVEVLMRLGTFRRIIRQSVTQANPAEQPIPAAIAPPAEIFHARRVTHPADMVAPAPAETVTPPETPLTPEAELGTADEPMPETLRELRQAVTYRPRETLQAWLDQETARGDKARKTYVSIITEKLNQI